MNDKTEDKTEKMRWIPVTERLPENHDEFVLVIASGSYQGIRLDNAYELATYDACEGWILELYPEATRLKITHWMPLPDAPEEEK